MVDYYFLRRVRMVRGDTNHGRVSESGAADANRSGLRNGRSNAWVLLCAGGGIIFIHFFWHRHRSCNKGSETVSIHHLKRLYLWPPKESCWACAQW